MNGLSRVSACRFVFLSAAHGAAGDLADCLSVNDRTVSAMQRCIVRATATSTYLIDDRWTIVQSIIVYRDGSHWRVENRLTARRPAGGKIVEETTRDIVCGRDGGSVQAVLDARTGQFQGALARLTPPERGVRDPLLQSGLSFLILGEIRFTEGTPWADTLDRNLPLQTVTADGQTYRRTDQTTPWGRYSVWFEAGADRSVRRISLRKGADDWFSNGRTVREASPNPQVPWEQLDVQVGVTEYGTADGVPYPKRFEVVEEIKNTGLPVSKYRTVCQVTELVLGPRFPAGTFDLSDVMPEGTPVTVETEEAIAYEWREGWVRKRIDSKALSRLGGQQFWRGSWLGRGLVGLGSMVLVAGSYWALRTIRRRAAH